MLGPLTLGNFSFPQAEISDSITFAISVHPGLFLQQVSQVEMFGENDPGFEKLRSTNSKPLPNFLFFHFLFQNYCTQLGRGGWGWGE